MVNLLHFFTYHLYLAILVEQLLLVVGGRPVTLSELEQESRLHLALAYSGEEASKATLNNDFLCAGLRTLALELLIEAEAERINWPRATAQEVEQARLQWAGQTFATKEAYQAFLAAHEYTIPELNAILSRHLMVASMMKHFIADKIVSERLLTEQAVIDYYKAEGNHFASLEEAKDALNKVVTAKVTREWTEDLLKRHKLQQVKIPDEVTTKNILGDCPLDSEHLLQRDK